MAEDQKSVDASDVATLPNLQPPPRSTINIEALGGALLWLIGLGIVGYLWFIGGRADVLLNVSGEDPLVADGRVTSGGAPVSAGTVQIVVEDPRGGRLLGSAVADVTNTGSFRVEFKESQFASRVNGLRVTGRYVGRTTDKDSKALKGTSTVYLNMTPPWTMGVAFLVVPAAIFVLVFLFTGPLPPKKARLLFSVTYVVTFSACVIPILLTVAAAQSPYLLEMMQDAPVGIIRAKAKGLDEVQWLVNIGGSARIVRPNEEVSDIRPLSAAVATQIETSVPAVLPAAAISPAEGTQPAQNGTSDAPRHATGAEAETFARGLQAAGQADMLSTDRPDVEVAGGLAIPLYVIVLAMLGAGINMTRKVPEIQANYDSQAAATWSGALIAPLAMLGMAKHERRDIARDLEPAEIRMELIQTYMYFLSAPFLAVAVYYLLQVVATSVAQPVLVVIAFASGLMSNATVGAIMVFADSMLDKLTNEKDASVATS